jgi:hypothetical protein
MNKLTIKKCLMIVCTSFTVVTVLLSAINVFADSAYDITFSNLLQLFLCITIISIAMYFTSKIQLDSPFDHIVMLLIVAVVVFVCGGLFHWFPWNWKYILQIAVILIIVFFVFHRMILWQSRETAKKINQKIQEKEKNESYH